MLPVLTIVALTGLSVTSAAGRAAEAGQARELVALGGTTARLAGQLQRERAAGALVFATSSNAASLAEFKRHTTATDALASGFRAELAGIRVPGNLQPLMSRIGDDLAGLGELRQKVTAAPDAVLSVVAFRYRAMIADLLSYRQALGQVGVSSTTANGLRSTAALSQAIESLSLLQVAGVRALTGVRLTPAGQEEIVAADTGVTEALQTFSDLGQPGWMAQLNTRIGSGPQILLAERLQGLVTRAQPGVALELGTDAQGWSAAVGARIDVMHGVEADLDSELLGAVTAERDAERRTILGSLGIVALLLIVVFVFGLIVARSLTSSLSRLQAGAREVATRRLPQLVDDLNVDNADPAIVERLVAAAAEPIPAQGSDEVAEVARAFNEVAASAVRIAGEQAALRAMVGAILVSLSRRLQMRTDAMMVSLDGLERKEEDPDRLGKLFALDHIATLIRRLIFNLHELAGGRAGRLRDRPVPLPDLLRAALQEIERYTRVETAEVDDAVEISGEVVDELIHLLAELLDNATWASPQETPVVITARHVGDLLHVQIRDSGTGMSEAQLQTARDRVANPRRLDFDTAQHMGLAVVGAIAQRLGIRVEFRSDLYSGTVVDLTVPGQWFSRRAAPMHEVTAELTPISAAVHTAPPPTWPPLPTPAGAVEPPVIFNELAQDASRSWFRQPTPGAPEPRTAELDLVGASVDWRTAARAARAAELAVPTEITPNGLPVRVPNQRLVPAGPVAAPAAPVDRQPERIRRQMAGFQHGLSLAAHRRAGR